MNIYGKPCGELHTNCYILEKNGKSLIIDPGVDSFQWIQENAKNPIAILNTHGHFDHVWSNKVVKEHYSIPVYIRKEDASWLESCPLGRGTPPCQADVIIENEEKIQLEDFEFWFFHAPGHTPGSTAIIFDEAIFSGDFIFDRSIGRVDFPFSNPDDMKKSIERFITTFKKDLPIYSGHGNPTSVEQAKEFLPSWLKFI
ncbi:MAG: MBL fold metallo-hydrolase [Campylobacterales bacterium]|nr:MBL fold metallo-hydrolase [Campylobacterales bacterium]